MTPLRPRRVVHRGSVLAAGLLIECAELASEREARQRILHLGVPGLAVWRRDRSLLVRFREPARLMVDAAPGAPLVAYGKVLSAAPLDSDELTSLAAAVDSVAVVVGGSLFMAPLEGASREDLAAWIDLSAFRAETVVHSLGEVAPAPVARGATVAPDVRAPLGVPPLSSEAAALVDALTKRKKKSGRGPAQPSSGVLAALARGLAAVTRGLAALFAVSSAGSRGPRRAERGLAVVAAAPRGNSWLSRAVALFLDAVARALVWSRIAPWIGRRQARYLARMLEMFETGDLEGALRHAIPLSADVAAGLSPPALLTPRPRTDLSIVPHRARATSSLGLADDLFSVLGRTYRRAFERLVAQGDIEKAAFVLAELLQASEEAVSFLERHGKWTLAAEIAEARELAPGLVIRQWFLAGERDRAVQIARRSGAFADAIQRLEGTHKEHARALRLLWASSLAEAGAFPAAIDAVWPVEAARGLAAAWLDRAIAVGGETGARMRVRKLRLLPGSFGEVRDEVRALLADDGDDGRRLALATANELLQGETSAGVRRVAGVVARALLGDVGDGEAARLGRRLLDVAGDGVLRADVLACRPEQAKAAPEAPPVSVQAFAVTHMGNVRTLNEDDVLATSLNDDFAASKRRAIEGEVSRGGVLLGVFDGVGGASSGEFASELVKKTVFDAMRGAFVTRGSDVSAWAATLREAVVAGGRELWREGVTNPARRGAGCTATVATVCGSTLLLAQVGDTRGYVLREKKLVQVTVDHTLVNQLLAEGKLSLEESASYEHQNVVTRALGVSEDVEVDLTGVALRRGDVVVLCSDGLSRMVGDAAIREALLGRAPHHACEALQSLALAAGGYDNLSIVVAEVGWGGLALPSAADPVLAVPIEGATLDDAPVDAVPLRARASAHRVRRVAADVGALRVWDAVELPDGRLLVALGELGARLLARDGRVLARFAQPTQHIVFSDHGDRAILVARRGEALRLARLDLLSKRVRPWCDARVSAFAPDFDGSCWYVGHENRVFAIAATAEGWGHDWTLEHAPVGGIARDPKELSVRFSSDGASAEVWTFESASRTLRSRRSYDGLTGPVATSAGGALVAWRDMRAVEEKGSGPAFWLGDRVRPFGTEGGALAGAGRPVITAEWIAFSAGVDGAEAGQRVLFFDTSALRERLVVVLEGATAAAVRVQGDRAVLCDDRGRVLVLSLRDGSVAREIRVS